MSEWISVKDKMPKEGQTVIITDLGFHHIATYEECALADDYIKRLQFNPDVMQVDGYEWETFSFEDVTHWMPLIESPWMPLSNKHK